MQLVNGCFSKKEATELLSQLINVKIRFHEGRILEGSSEEDIKFLEKRIKQLQKDLFDLSALIERKENVVDINSEIYVQSQ